MDRQRRRQPQTRADRSGRRERRAAAGPAAGRPGGRRDGQRPAVRHGTGHRRAAAAAARPRPAVPAARRGGRGGERFRVTGRAGRITVAGTSPAVLLTGVNWYLEAAKADITWAGEQLDLPRRLPAPGAGHGSGERRRTASPSTTPTTATPARTPTGRTGSASSTCSRCTAATRCWSHRARTPSTTGTFQEFGYSDAELRAWLPAPGPPAVVAAAEHVGLRRPGLHAAHRRSGPPSAGGSPTGCGSWA